MALDPYVPDFSPGTLDIMRARLLSARWPAIIGEDSWNYGVPQAWMKDMVRYWANEWDWSAEQERMLRYEHFRVDLDGLPIHFMRVKGTGPDPIPIICTHGWPWTFWDFKDVVDGLADPTSHGAPDAQSFDVIVPSLPGFGFSTPLETAGIGPAEIGDRWVALMTEELGYDKFLAHGGDWGSIITSWMGHAHADKMLGVHMSLPTIPSINRSAIAPDDYADDEQWMLDRAAEAGPLIRSHVSVHMSDPQTLAYAMADSPVGTAAWIWERRRNWSDCGGDVETVFTREHLCTTAAIYWGTGSLPSSLRLYYQYFNNDWNLVHDRPTIIEAPTAYVLSPKELVFLPKAAAARWTNLTQWTTLDAGGHFAAAEQPEAIIADIRSFVAKL